VALLGIQPAQDLVGAPLSSVVQEAAEGIAKDISELLESFKNLQS
jgi:hypothetical protein